MFVTYVYRNDLVALKETSSHEVTVLEKNWKGTPKKLLVQKKAIQTQYKKREQELVAEQKEKKRKYLYEIKILEKAITDAEYRLNVLTNKGKLQIILKDAELIGKLKDRWINKEVAKRLDYPIFMAVSERGGKNSSGEYEHLIDDDGNLVEFPEGHPQEGHPMIDQDCVNFELSALDMQNASRVPDEKICIAEAFVRFAQKYNFDFWRMD